MTTHNAKEPSGKKPLDSYETWSLEGEPCPSPPLLEEGFQRGIWLNEAQQAHACRCPKCQRTASVLHRVHGTHPTTNDLWRFAQDESSRLATKLHVERDGCTSCARTVSLFGLVLGITDQARSLTRPIGDAARGALDWLVASAIPIPVLRGAQAAPTGVIVPDILDVHRLGNRLRWTLPIENSRQEIHLEASVPADVLLLVHGGPGWHKEPLLRQVSLKRLELEDTEFVWQAWITLGEIDKLRSDYGEHYTVSVAVEPGSEVSRCGN